MKTRFKKELDKRHITRYKLTKLLSIEPRKGGSRINKVVAGEHSVEKNELLRWIETINEHHKEQCEKLGIGSQPDLRFEDLAVSSVRIKLK